MRPLRRRNEFAPLTGNHVATGLNHPRRDFDLRGAMLVQKAITWFIRGEAAQCPTCGHQRFSGPTKLDWTTKITCAECGYVMTVGNALRASIKARGVKKFREQHLLKSARKRSVSKRG